MKGERTAKGRVATRPFGRVLANRGILPGESLSWTIFLEKLPKVFLFFSLSSLSC